MRHAIRALAGRAPARLRRLAKRGADRGKPEEGPSEFEGQHAREVYALPHFTVHRVEVHDDLGTAHALRPSLRSVNDDVIHPN